MSRSTKVQEKETMTDLNSAFDCVRRIQTGTFWASQQDLILAQKLFESALDMDPVNIAALNNTAFLLLKRKELEKAQEMMSRALAVDPEHPHTLGIAALLAQEIPQENRFEKARELFEKSLKNNPADVTVHLNYAYMLQVVGDYHRALEIYTRARDLNVMDMSARFQRSLCLMTLAETPQQWKEALDEYEIRHLIYNTGGPQRGKAMYTGREVGLGHGGLLITCEQGIGDAVMCARYARYLKESGVFKNIYMLCLPPWVDLMGRMEGVDGVYTTAKDAPEFDYFVPSMSLMRAEGYPTIQPPSTPYLKHSENFEFGSFGSSKLKVGLAWAGNPQHGNDRWRSIGPDLFSDAFAGVDGVSFYSLHQQETNRFKPEFVHDCNVSTLGSLADVIQSMDLIVTVDTSILHIAGASGVPTFGLLASNPDFRWGHKGLDTSWYPSVRLLRADKPLNWKPVLDRAAKKVEMFANMHRTANA